MSEKRQSGVGCAGYSRFMHTASPAAPIAAATLTGPDYILRMDSPIGRIEVTADEGAITSLSIERQGHLPWEELPERTSDVLEAARVQLDEYFRGERAEFDLPLRLVGTPFQRQVWQLLGDVPFGDGCVDFAAAFKTLAELNYRGAFLIEMWTEKAEEPIAEIINARRWIEDKMQQGGL